MARDLHLDLGRAPYVFYGVKYIDLVSLAPFPGTTSKKYPDISRINIVVRKVVGVKKHPGADSMYVGL